MLLGNIIIDADADFRISTAITSTLEVLSCRDLNYLELPAERHTLLVEQLVGLFVASWLNSKGNFLEWLERNDDILDVLTIVYSSPKPSSESCTNSERTAT